MGLDSPIEAISRIDKKQLSALHRLGIRTFRDLLYFFPVKYAGASTTASISSATTGEHVILYGKISKLKTKKSFRGKIPMAEATFTDTQGSMKLVWFNQAYIARLIQNDSLVKIQGKITERNGARTMQNPLIESVSAIPELNTGSLFSQVNQSGETTDIPRGNFVPIYRESQGITSRWIYHAILKMFKMDFFQNLEDSIPNDILRKYNLPSLQSALIWIHTPEKESHAEIARKRFAFEEIFMIQLDRQREKMKLRDAVSYPITTAEEKVQEFVDRFEFDLTESQLGAINDIFTDIQKNIPMSRLLEGDVGSGKTAVAATATFATVSTKPKGQMNGALQVAYMAPTEILAKQHFESFIQYFRHMPVSIALITGKGCRKFPSKVNPGGWTNISRTQLLKWVANGDIAVVIGTHALIQKSVKFKNLTCVIIDEQHRFGVEQRKKLVKKHEQVPHLLSMTATPIPRTLALTLYGDLDLSILDTMPSGRKPIITDIVTPHNRKSAYEHIQKQINEGRQAYVICPRIDLPDEESNPSAILTVATKAVITEAKRLKKEVFPEFNIGIIHSKMKPDDKEKIMSEFASRKIDILVSTSVIEVGVNVPNATTILIEGAERFGLAQLHQLRGRVIRGNHQAYCFLATDSEGETAIKRLSALKNTRSGFDLAELDLKERGAGSLGNGKQWGITDVGMEALKNLKMVEAARKEAFNIITHDPELKSHPLLEMALRPRKEIHFE